jgi:hypothetical protein
MGMFVTCFVRTACSVSPHRSGNLCLCVELLVIFCMLNKSNNSRFVSIGIYQKVIVLFYSVSMIYMISVSWCCMRHRITEQKNMPEQVIE